MSDVVIAAVVANLIIPFSSGTTRYRNAGRIVRHQIEDESEPLLMSVVLVESVCR